MEVEELDQNYESTEQSTESVEENTDQIQEEQIEHSDEYQPNFGYTVRKKDYEFDDWIRPVITNQETEAQVRRLYEKATGVDFLDEHIGKLRGEKQDLENSVKKYQEDLEFSKQGVEGLKQLAKSDFGAFAHLAGIDDQTILSYANQRLDYKEKPEYERQQIDHDMQVRSQSYSKELELNNLKRQNETLLRTNHNQKMSQAMAQPEISTFAEKFDKRMGEDGAFVRHVRNYGSQQFQTTQQYVEPLVAVQHV